MKTWWLRGLLILFLGAVIYAALPWYSARQLIEASRQGDVAQMERYIDFPLLRANIKQHLQQELRASMGGNVPQELDGLFNAGSDLILGPVVERLVSPRAIAEFIQGRKEWRELEKELESAVVPADDSGRNAPPPKPVEKSPVESGSDSAAEQARRRWQLQRWSFSGLNQVTVVCGSEADHKQVELYLERQGLRWRLVDLTLVNKDKQGD
ncbi:DUF2939 domain-containing protein [Microbulbifer aggregans]|uniref:DUF2939 domain-containing protein n=1 Tax=Microbulbifer aggregans TaxID=1769779 RepID=UPI001CFE9E87|nr:DUF2939 domain-containing protein [Microbulbifer aggregans]